jgi:hypothetical protein
MTPSFSGWVSLRGGPLDGCEFYLPDDFADLTVLVIRGHRYRLMMAFGDLPRLVYVAETAT